MTEVRNPEIVALSPMESNKLEEDKLSPIQVNKGSLLGNLHLNNSEGVRHHTNLSLSDKEQIQEVNDDDLLSQINDICGDDQELNEPKSAISYEKESLESISEESLPHSNTESLLCEESNERSVSALNIQDENQPSNEIPTSPVQNESPTTEIRLSPTYPMLLRSPVETQSSPEKLPSSSEMEVSVSSTKMQPSVLDIETSPKETATEISIEKVQPSSVETQLSPMENASPAEEIKKFPSDIHTEDEDVELSLLVDDDEEIIVKEDSTKSEGSPGEEKEVSVDAITEVQETNDIEVDSQAKEIGLEENDIKEILDEEDDSQLKEGDLLLKDGDSDEELESKNDNLPLEKESELIPEDSKSKEESIQMENESPEVVDVEMKAVAASPVHFESQINEPEVAITKDESTQNIMELDLDDYQNNPNKEESIEERRSIESDMKEGEISEEPVTHSSINPLKEEESNKEPEEVVDMVESNEAKDIESKECQSTEENKRKREKSPISEEHLALQNGEETGTKRLKSSEETIDDSDDEILFYPVNEETKDPKETSKPVPEDSDDEPIIFYKVPRPAPTPVDDDDDDVQIIEDASSETKKHEVDDTKSEKDVKDLEKETTPKDEKKEELETKEKVEEKLVTIAENTNQKESSEEVKSSPSISEVGEHVDKPEEMKTKVKNEDSDDDIVIVEDDNNVNPPVTLTEEAAPPSVKKEIEEKLETEPETKLVPENEKTVEIKKEKDQQDRPKELKEHESKKTKEIESTVCENDKETTVSLKKENLEVDNSDNACDVSVSVPETKDTNTNDLDEVGSNCSNSSNLLKSGTKSAMDQEREDYGKAKRMRMSIDQDDLTSNMSSDTDVSQSYSSHSLKRSHSKSPSLKGNDDSQSKKTKLSDSVEEKLTIDKDIMKKVNKKLKKITHKELEHLVLQKIVESINYESKLSSLNEELEKSHEKIEKITQIYTNLKKQYNDLQLVHNRVTSDLEKRNTSYVMPIKITRAVGLQVSIGAKGAVSDHRNTYVLSNASNTSSTTVSKPPVPSPAQTQTSTPTSSQTTVQTPSPTVRRGCIQKITPKRPVPVKTNATPPAMSPLTPQQAPKLLNRSAPSTPILPKALIKTTISTPPTQPSLTIANLERNIQKLTASNPIIRQTATSVMKKTAGGGPQTAKGLNTTTSIVKQLTPSVSIESVNSELKPKGVIDLTDEDDVPPPQPQNTYNGIVTRQQSRPPPAAIKQSHPQNTSYAVKIAPKQSQQLGEKLYQQLRFKHPAPLPRVPEQKSLPHWKPIPPKPIIRINNSRAGIVISWAMEQSIDRFATITNYQIYAYQAPNDIAPSTEHWRYVDVVEAMLLPMAVTLTEFQEGLKYFFSVRAVDEYKRVGPFSLPRTWDSVKNN